MTRTILMSLAVAAVLSLAATPFALGQDGDFQVWRKNFGPVAGSSKSKGGWGAGGGWPSKYETIPSGKESDGKSNAAAKKKVPKLQEPAVKGKVW